MSLLPCLRGKEERSCFALFHGDDDSLYVTLIDAATQSKIHAVSYDARFLKRFIRDIPKFFAKKLKAVILQFYGFEKHDYKNNIDLRQAFRTRLAALNIPHYFSSNLQFMFGSIIIKANIASNIGEKIMVGRVFSTTIIGILELQNTKDGYKKLDFDMIQGNQDAACRKIIELCKSHKIVVIEYPPGNTFLKSLKMKNLILIERNGDLAKFTAEMSKWLLDKSYTKFFIAPVCEGNFSIRNSAAEKILSITDDDFLPVEKSDIVGKFLDVILQCQISITKPLNMVHKIDCQKCHRNKIMLSVDAEGFPTFTAEPIVLPQITSILTTLTKTVESKIPVIGFCDNFSVICIHKDDKSGYQFSNGWNGVYGTELVISFCSEKPLFGEEALSSTKSTISYAFEENGKILTVQEPKKPIYGKSKKKPFQPSNEVNQYEPGYLVYDFINIMSMPADKIKFQDLWGFRITKDDDHPVLLEFMNHEKELKQASPAFLMALLLKEHIKVIKTEIGEKPEKLGFFIFEKFASEQQERIKNGIKEACEMIKIGFELIHV